MNSIIICRSNRGSICFTTESNPHHNRVQKLYNSHAEDELPELQVGDGAHVLDIDTGAPLTDDEVCLSMWVKGHWETKRLKVASRCGYGYVDLFDIIKLKKCDMLLANKIPMRICQTSLS